MKRQNITLTILLFLLNSFTFAQNYTFNAKGSFRIKNSEGTAESYFYLNTKNGNVGQDTKAWQMITKESTDVPIFSLVEYGKQMTQYIQVEGKKYVMAVPLSKENYTATQFWKDFKKTGKRQTFGKYNTQEYVGMAEGKRLSIWIGDKTYNLDGKLQGDIVGFLGVGYLYKPNENAYYLLVHFKDDESEVTLLDITPFNYTFNGSGYQKMPTMGAGANPYSGQNQIDTQTPTPTSPNIGQYGAMNYKCATIYEQSIMVIEQSLPAAREMLKNNEIPAEQKNEMRKVVTCMERKLPILKQALAEAKTIDSKFGSNFDKLSEECGKLQDKYQERLDKVCE